MITGQFFTHFQAEPHFNMGFDEWLLSEALGQPGFMALRIYTWAPGAITFGFNQRQETALDWKRLGETPVIRRVTGGRALYHDPSELTYSVVLNQQGLTVPGLTGAQPESSRVIAELLVIFLSRLGIHTDYRRRSSGENSHPEFFHKAPCFASTAKFEVTRGPEKIIASAQRRLSSCLLQHGSIKLMGLARHAALPGILGASDQQAQPLSLERFEEYGDILRDTFSSQTGMLIRDRTLAEPQILHLDEAVARVKKNPHAQREIIERTAGTNSL